MAPSSKLGRGKPLRSQTKEVLHKIFKYFEKEIDRDPNSTVTAAQLVSHSTGVSTNAVKRILSEYRTSVTVKKEYKSSRRRCRKNIITDEFDAQAIRRTVHSFYTKDEEFPIMKDLLLILKADIDYQGSICTLRRQISTLGFKWTETEDNNAFLVEKHDYRFSRIKYLTKIDEFKSQGRSIVYTGEAFIESSRVSSKPRADGSTTFLKQPAKSKLVILHAADFDGFLPNTLLMYDANKKEFREEIDSKRENIEVYDKWFKCQLIPNLKPNSVVVVDSGSAYHSRLLNPTPHSNSRKQEIMDWLTARNVPYSPDMYKPQLYQLVLLNRDKFSGFKSDVLLTENGHTTLRMPSNHPDLNPVKNIFGAVKTYLGRDLSINSDSVMKIAYERLDSVTSEEWRQACRQAEAEENSLKALERVMDEISERSFKNIDEDSEETDVEDVDNASDQDSVDSD